MKNRNERLTNWINTLTSAKKDALLFLCVSELIDSEFITFREDSKVPY